ncbi:MAG: SDR family NAD(P)-dependent oxidoreductase [Muribaculaceae bacterium]|nr:SDR family NAD(P)-dependent oxidoreductase [Muribaculaceae bacterium]
MKKVIIMGATSGLGRALAERYIKAGWNVGAAGRNEKALAELTALAPDQVVTAKIDILSDDAPAELRQLISLCGGMDTYLHCSGVAMLNEELSLDTELKICETNAVGFTRMCETAYHYFETSREPGRLVAISSIAGFRGLEMLPAYSASKAYDSVLLEALRQRADGRNLPLRVVDIKPGWTRTPLLADDKHYMLEMDAETVADLIFKASLKAKRSVVIGLRWKLITSLERLVPSCIWQKIHIPIWK